MTITNPLRIGYAICELLMRSEMISSRVNGRIYAYTSKGEAKLPCITYEGISIDYDECKDGVFASEVTMQLNVLSTDYPTGIDIAEEVLDALSEHEGIVPVSVSCDYDVAATMFTHVLTLRYISNESNC